MLKWGTYQDCSLVGKSPSFHHSATPTNTNNHHTIIMSFDDASESIDNVLGTIYGESSTIPPSHYKASARTPTSRPRGRQTPKPPCTSSFPCQAVIPTIPPSTSTVTSFAGEIASSLILFSLRSMVGLRARPFTTIDSRTSICETLSMLGRWFGGTGIGMWS